MLPLCEASAVGQSNQCPVHSSDVFALCKEWEAGSAWFAQAISNSMLEQLEGRLRSGSNRMSSLAGERLMARSWLSSRSQISWGGAKKIESTELHSSMKWSNQDCVLSWLPQSQQSQSDPVQRLVTGGPILQQKTVVQCLCQHDWALPHNHHQEALHQKNNVNLLAG